MKVLTAARNAHNDLVADAENAAHNIMAALNGILMVHDGEKAANFFSTVRGEMALAYYGK